MRLMLCIIMGVLALATKIYGNDSDCPESILRGLKQNEWVRCNEENDRRMEDLKRKTSLDHDEKLRQACCVLSNTITCWVDTLRSKCGDASANVMIRGVKFEKDCSSWIYPDSISQCQSQSHSDRVYTKWWFITIIAILAIVIIAAVVFVVLRKRARSSR